MIPGQMKIGNVVALPGAGHSRIPGTFDQVDPASVREMVDRQVPDGGEDVFLDQKRSKRPRDRPRMGDHARQILALRWRRIPVLFRSLPRKARRLLWEDELHGWEICTWAPRPRVRCAQIGRSGNLHPDRALSSVGKSTLRRASPCRARR